jgi:hypothetical protein
VDAETTYDEGRAARLLVQAVIWVWPSDGRRSVLLAIDTALKAVIGERVWESEVGPVRVRVDATASLTSKDVWTGRVDDPMRRMRDYTLNVTLI